MKIFRLLDAASDWRDRRISRVRPGSAQRKRRLATARPSRNRTIIFHVAGVSEKFIIRGPAPTISANLSFSMTADDHCVVGSDRVLDSRLRFANDSLGVLCCVNEHVTPMWIRCALVLGDID